MYYSLRSGGGAYSGCCPGTLLTSGSSYAPDGCNRQILIYTTNPNYQPSNTVTYKNRVYSTLADVPVDTNAFTCQGTGTYLSPPSGWFLAPYDADSGYVAGTHYWSTDRMVLQGGYMYYLLGNGNGGAFYGCCYLYTSGSSYAPYNCDTQILIYTIIADPTSQPSRYLLFRYCTGIVTLE